MIGHRNTLEQMMSTTRMVAVDLRELSREMPAGNVRDAMREGGAAIDALLDAIEAGGMVQTRQAPAMDLGPLRELRAWHKGEAFVAKDRGNANAVAHHKKIVTTLNAYFPKDDQL